jgi:hypothetical protein
MRRQAGEILVTPIRKIYDPRSLNLFPRGLVGRFQNVQSIAIEQKSVVPKQFVQLRNHRMTVGNGLGFELVDGSFDLYGSQFHRSVLSVGPFVLHRQRRESRVACPATPRWSNTGRYFPRRATWAHLRESIQNSGEPGDQIYEQDRAYAWDSIAAYRPQSKNMLISLFGHLLLSL